MSILLLFFLKSMGKVRVSAEDEAKGMDETKTMAERPTST